MHEPFICPECGREGRRARKSEVCTFCEREYREGMQDAVRWQEDRRLFGDEYAAQEELRHYLRFGDD